MVKFGTKEDGIMDIILMQNNRIILCIVTILFTLITMFLQNKILMQILNIKEVKFTKIFLFQTALFSLTRIIIPIWLHKIIEILTQILIYKRYLRVNTEKVLFAEEINVIIFSVTELISIKIFTELCEVNSIESALASMDFMAYITITAILVKLLIYILLKKFNITINIPEYISCKSKKQIIEVATVSTILIIFNEIEILNCMQTIPNTIYLLDIILLISYYLISTTSMLKTLQIETDKNKINNLESSNDRLQHNYDNICALKHDFGNIMQGFGGFIATKDFDGLQRMYNDVICECQALNNIKAFDKGIINNPAIYNLINNKYLLAKQYDIEINLEVYIDFNSLKIKTYELCRILGVLIDNAIEAAKDCEEKVINIKFLKDNYNKRNLIVIENTCKNYLIDINKMKEKGFSTKKNKMFHGLGLWKVNQIIKKNENLRLYTTRDKMFKQQLEIYSWD